MMIGGASQIGNNAASTGARLWLPSWRRSGLRAGLAVAVAAFLLLLPLLFDLAMKTRTDLLLYVAWLSLNVMCGGATLAGLCLARDSRAAECACCPRQTPEAKLRSFLEHSPAVGFLKDITGRVIYSSVAYCHEFRAGGEPLDLKDGQGNWRTLELPVRGNSGELLTGGVSIEVTARSRAREALRESEERYRQIVEYASDVIVRCDVRGRVTYINEMGARLLKTPSPQLCGRRALGLIRPDARRRARRQMWHALMRGASDIYEEVPVVIGDGTELWLGQNIRVLRQDGSVQGFQAICHDITERRRMETQLRANEQRFRLLYENGPVAYHEIDTQGVIRRVNRAECELLGYAEAELIGRPVLDLLTAADRELAGPAIRAKVSQETPLKPFQRMYVRKDGRRVRVEIHENLLRDDNSSVIGIHSVLLDITQRYLAEMLDRDRWKVSEMMAQQQPLERVLMAIASMISHQDDSLFCIPIRIGDQQVEPIRGDASLEHPCNVIRHMTREAFQSWTAEGFHVRHRKIAEMADSPEFEELAIAAAQLGAVSCWSLPIVSSSQLHLGLLLVFSRDRDEPTEQEHMMLEAASRISALAIEHRYMTDLLAFQASHDSLTRLPNRSSFEDRLRESIAQAAQREELLAVLYVDLDRFKEVNDTYGHSGGDELLRQVATRLRKCIRHADTLARIGGDEFSLLLGGLREAADADRLAETIIRAFDDPFEVAGCSLQITASIGISVYPRDGTDAPALQRNSDTAMYRVKNTGKNGFQCYYEQLAVS